MIFGKMRGGILEGKLREFACFSRKCGIIEITGGLLSEWRAGDLIFPGSSMVEQEAVNFEVAGSSPAPGAMVSECFALRSLVRAVFCFFGVKAGF